MAGTQIKSYQECMEAENHDWLWEKVNKLKLTNKWYIKHIEQLSQLHPVSPRS